MYHLSLTLVFIKDIRKVIKKINNEKEINKYENKKNQF